MIHKSLLFAIVCLLSISNLRAQNDSIQQLDEIVLKAPILKQSVSILPMSVSVKSSEEKLLESPQVSLKEQLGSVPGLFVQNQYNYNQDLRISIRGFGARSSFGIRGIKLIVDGIPETTPDGQGQIDNIPVSLMRTIEVIRGPSASLYGNAAGGVIYLNTLDALKDKVELKVLSGGYGLQIQQLNVGINHSNTSGILSVNHTKSQGYRDHSSFEQYVVNAKINKSLFDNSQLVWLLNYTNSPLAQDAGGVDESRMNQGRTLANPSNVSFDSREKIAHFKTGISVSSQVLGGTLSSLAYASNRVFEGFLPFKNGGVTSFNRAYYGLANSYKKSFQALSLATGWQYDKQTDHRYRYVNELGIKGDELSNQKDTYANFGVYALGGYRMEQLNLRAGIRFDRIHMSNDVAQDDKNYQVFNPSLGASYALNSSTRIFSHYSTSFETPTLSELSTNPNNLIGFNGNLKPIEARNFELGFKGNRPHFFYEWVVFNSQTTNELLAYEIETYPGRDFYKNVGATSRKGVELAVKHQFAHWTVDYSYTFSDFKLKEQAQSDIENKMLPGIPKHHLYYAITYRKEHFPTLKFEGDYWNEMFANDRNTVKIGDQFYANFSAHYPITIKNFKINTLVGIHNIFNNRYYDNIRLNAFGGRYYEPAPQRNGYLGVQISW